jgi:hypothetical protein
MIEHWTWLVSGGSSSGSRKTEYDLVVVSGLDGRIDQTLSTLHSILQLSESSARWYPTLFDLETDTKLWAELDKLKGRLWEMVRKLQESFLQLYPTNADDTASTRRWMIMTQDSFVGLLVAVMQHSSQKDTNDTEMRSLGAT